MVDLIYTEDDYRDMCDNSEGICLACGEIRDCCEPDARNYKCESCGERKVFGVEELLMMGKLYIIEDSEE
jgi:hypothetical protein